MKGDLPFRTEAHPRIHQPLSDLTDTDFGEASARRLQLIEPAQQRAIGCTRQRDLQAAVIAEVEALDGQAALLGTLRHKPLQLIRCQRNRVAA